jgi:toxin-antitoxin system PIN domain toxin
LILLDANLLIYAYIREVPQHRSAREWLDRQLTEASAVGFPWESITAFLRIVTNPRILERPIPIAVAWQQARDWLASEPAWVPQATERQARLLGELLTVPGLRANDVPDAYLAALAIDHGLILCSADAGFARFSRLRWRNPLVD